MISASRWIILLDLADTPVIRGKIKRIQRDALKSAIATVTWHDKKDHALKELRGKILKLEQ